MLLFGLLLTALTLVPVFSQAQEKPILSLKTVVIDAGHGGKDPGTVWDGVREKDINLDVAMRFGSLIKATYPEVKVIFTRDKDEYLPLNARSNIANKNKADLFISIHVNSVQGSSSARGTETFLMGTDKSGKNMDVCKLENSVILLEEDYSTTYAGYDPNSPDSFIFFNLMQNAQFEQSILMASLVESKMAAGPVAHSRGIKQAPLLVLWTTTMPSVLVEIGFLSNPSDREKLKDRKGRASIAQCLFNAFAEFKNRYEVTGDITPVEIPVVADVENGEIKTIAHANSWRIQIMVASRELDPKSEIFKEVPCDFVKVGNMYKYFTGDFNSRFEAASKLAAIKELFPGSFIVEFGPDGNPKK